MGGIGCRRQEHSVGVVVGGSLSRAAAATDYCRCGGRAGKRERPVADIHNEVVVLVVDWTRNDGR